ncbi:TOMM precursor leader peptide-binding protein [Halovivax limisalsi]|uniref:TOMM precursor leader peptide-binding protein n=1 Tax=Halovivax limisalsi TaxID=1453760 RepID=UPI001FFD64D9|nr:TOMM precursor leader peptide-binding protein [Halovivax limisalsi]
MPEAPDSEGPDRDCPERPLLNPTVTPLCRDGRTLHLVANPMNGPSYTLRDEDDERVLAKLPVLLDGTRRVENIARELEYDDVDALRSAIEALYDRNLVLDGASVERPSVVGYAALKPTMLEERARDGIEATVLVIGPERPGAYVLNDLRDYGVSNVRASGAAANALDRDDGLAPATDPLADEVERAGFVVALERLPGDARLREVNEFAVEAETPLLVATIDRTAGTVGPTIVPNQTACYDCYRTRLRANASDPDRFDAYLSGGADPETGPLEAFERIIASYATLACLNYLLSGAGLTVGSQLTFDFFEWSIESNDVLKLPRCPCCSRVELGHQRFVELEDVWEPEQ